MTWTHDKLADDLAGHLRTEQRMVWTDIQLGPAGSPRPDVYTLMRSFVDPRPTAYEVKISRADFLSDVTAGKWQKYRKFAGSIVFAVPAGLVKKEEIPPTCGVIMRYDGGWRSVRRATPHVVEIPQSAWLKLLIDGVAREGGATRLETGRLRRADDAACKLFGAEVARQLRDAHYAPSRVAYAEERAAQILAAAQRDAEVTRQHREKEAPKLWADLLAALGLPPEATSYAIGVAIRGVQQEVAPSIPREDVMYAIGQIEWHLDRLKAKGPP